MPLHPYYKAVRAIYDAMVAEVKYKTEDYNIIGSSPARFDGYPKAAGKAQYVSDLQLPGMLWGKFLHSPYAHARIQSIDIADAQKIPGVKAILTSDDKGVLDPAIPKPIEGITVLGGLPLISSKANYEGECVGAVVCAESEALCDQALAALKIEWEELPFVTTVEDAMKPGAPQLFADKPGNVYHQATFTRGRVLGDYPYDEDTAYTIDEGFRDADILIEDRIKWDQIPMAASEPNACVAEWCGDQLNIWLHTQRPQNRPSQIAVALGMAASKIVLKQLYNGGCFGQNHLWSADQARYDLATAILARITGAPVKMQMSRKDYFLGSDIEAIIDLKIGAKDDGAITAVYGNFMWGGGAPGGSGTLWSGMNHGMNWVDMDLKCAYKADNTTYYTNTAPKWWWRSEQNVNARFLQQVLDYVAYATGVDPGEVMLKNARIPEPSCREVISEAKTLIDWDSKWHKPGEKTLPTGKKHGIGFYFGHEWGNYTDAHVSAGLTCNPDGTVTISGVKEDLGGAEHTTYAMIVAEEMGVKLSDIHFSIMNSDCGFVLQGSGGAAGLHGSAWCLAKLGILARAEILKKAVPVLKVATADELDMKDSVIFVKADESKKTSLASLFTVSDGSSTWLNVSTEVHGMYWGEENVMKIFTPMHNYQAFVCEVEVDPETGGVDVTRIVTVNDVGRAIRSATVEGQQYGGAYMAVGRAVEQDQAIYDPMTGVNLTSDLLGTHIAINKDCGPIETSIKEIGHGDGPYGLTGIGEDTTDCGAPALMAAVYNAIGKKVDPPCTPDRILKALGKA